MIAADSPRGKEITLSVGQTVCLDVVPETQARAK